MGFYSLYGFELFRMARAQSVGRSPLVIMLLCKDSWWSSFLVINALAVCTNWEMTSAKLPPKSSIDRVTEIHAAEKDPDVVTLTREGFCMDTDEDILMNDYSNFSVCLRMKLLVVSDIKIFDFEVLCII